MTKVGRIGSYKSWELDTWFTENAYLLGFSISYTRKRDHAGIRIEFQIWNLSVDFTIYDNRHWDHKTDDWVKYNKES